nr:MAG TPA: hypothetical protein [Caudoviricetes sp.]DAX36655.1 MAG TPA: hypothetical protein [Caudoviricetes sp.]
MKQPRQPATTVLILPAGAGTFIFAYQMMRKMGDKMICASFAHDNAQMKGHN